MSNLGWNEGTWGNNPWGGRITVAVTVSGLSATASTNDIPAVHFNAPLPIFLAYSDGTWGLEACKYSIWCRWCSSDFSTWR